MSKLVYSALTSLNGHIEDAGGGFEWAVPDAEVHTYINELEQRFGTHVYGRRLYETMAVWQTMGASADEHPAEVQYADIWRSLDKVVYSRSLPDVWTERTRLEREFDPAGLERLKAESDRDISIGGPELARHAFRAGLVDEIHLFVFPVVVSGGKHALPQDVHLPLELVDHRRFESGVVHLHHRVR